MISINDVVVDPADGGVLRRATDAELTRIADAAKAGAASSSEGEVPEKLSGAYVASDGRSVYVDDPRGFPSLLVERRLVLDEAL